MATTRLTIGFVLDDSLDRPDGVQQYVVALGEWLRASGHDVWYLVSATRRRDLPRIEELAANIGVTFNGNFMRTPLPASKLHIQTVLRENHFDVLHVQMPYSPLLAGRVIRAANKTTALVGTFHVVPRTLFASLLNRGLALWSRRTTERLDVVLTPSSASQAVASKVFRLESGVVPVPVVLDAFRSAQPWPKDGQTLEILFLGRLVPRKGCMNLLKALSLLRRMKDVPSWHTTICGTGPLVPRLRQYARDHGLSRRVTFTGFVSGNDKPRYFASADLTVFPSTGGESFGVVLVEAMASGKSAVIAGDNPGYRALLEYCPGDVLFKPRDSHALAEKLRSLLIDQRERRHIAAWQGHYVEQFDIAHVGREVLRTYVRAVRARRHVR